MKEFLKEKLHYNLNKTLSLISFACYLIILIWIIIFKYNNPKTINVLIDRYLNLNITDRFLLQFEHTYVDRQAVEQVLLNIPVFIPFTLFLPLLFKKQNILRDLAITLGFSLLIELVQLFTSLGGFEFMDVLMNLIGGLIGCIVFKIFRRFTSNTVINYINLIIVIIALPFALYAIINTGIHHYLYKPFF